MDKRSKELFERKIQSALYFYVFGPSPSCNETFRMVRDSHHLYRTSTLGEVKTTKEWNAELYPETMKSISVRNGGYDVVRNSAVPKHRQW